ncbi:unnamed protein product [Pieris macdunnoughi]|uniref:DUF4795 domain-containing protein n=1 Tax=Pieris macdunnoughi TaxID=345717 RepID=A0A821QTB5_9NEOP|nr:unnamed protein product [Pieris macdunnoughi]
MSKRRGLDEPNMSDTGLLVTVEDLINQAMGPPSVNMINFKVMQAVLHILARQQRLLEQRVEIKIAEVSPPRHKLKKHSEVIEDSSESSSSPSPKRSGFKEEREPRKRERGQREMERAEKLAQRAREKEERAASRERDKAQRATSKEREKAEKAALKEREKAEKTAYKEREREEKASSKERERAAKAQLKAEREASKEKDKEERAASKEREKAEKAMSKAERAASKEREKEVRTASKERERAEKAQSKAERAASKEREKEERTASKERERAEKAQSKAERAASKEREKEERTASKEREKAEKEQSKAERAASKEREKEERAASKEREKEERTASKEREKAIKEQSKAERAASKEREKEEKLALKEKEKADKEQSKSERQAQRDLEKNEKQALKEQDKAEREQKKAEKLSRKEQEKAERAAQKEKERMENEENKSAKKGRKPSDSGISIKEVKRGKDSVLVVEKGPTTWSDAQGRGSIEVVTQSQFALLEAAVRDLRDMAAPQPLAMPDNEKLRSDLAKGQATLPDTMQAMQIDARVKAAESAIARMTGLLTQLAAAGELPEDLGQQMEEIQMERAADMRAEDLKARPSLARKSVIIAPSAKISEGSTRGAMLPRPSTAPAPRPSVSIMKQPSSRISTTTLDQGVSRDEMDDAVNRLREDLIKAMNLMTSRAGATADNALHTAKSASDKVDVATTLDARISTLHSLAVDYADQLNGFDAGLSTQMQSFREQMVQMRGDLQGGLTLLETVNNNAETAAVVELTSRYQELVTELESTLHSHRALTKLQTQLADELRSLVECVELLRDQKADKDEVADGLRDKADTSRLAGLLTETEFALARADLERRLAVCHDKFQRQDNVWMTAVKDLNKILDGKSEILDLLSCRDEVQKQLQLLHERLQVLAAVLGEPKAAAVKRQLAVGASCAACGTAALMSPRDATRGAPPRLPALRPPPAEAPSKEPCLKDWMPPDLPDDRHVCRRWCGGSHTMVTESTRREQATAVVTEGAPTKRYTGYGADGRLYKMEEELQPCVECNQIAEEKTEVPPLDIGAGDQNPQQEMVVNIHLTGLE